MTSLNSRLLLGLALLGGTGSVPAPAADVAASAQATGVIVGRILNARSGAYVRDAEIQVEHSDLTAVSAADGSYRLTGVAPGAVTLVVNYTGHPATRVRVVVSSGGEVIHNIELSGTRPADASDDSISLEAFVVSSEREGNAKAIMRQRNSMNVTNSVASDVFGDVAEGNVGEFLKHLPGVELDTVEGDVRTVRLRGLGSEYTAVTLDGVSIASADANAGASGNARAFSFEQVSLNSMDSIEVSKTVSADVDANAPAGTINLRTKRAFDRNGRRISWQTNVTAHSSAMTLSKTDGIGNTPRRPVLPGGIFEYSDVFWNKRLGVVLNVSESNVYAVSSRSTMTYNYAPTAADPRPVVPATIAQTIGPRTTERFTTTLTVDLRATSRLTLGLGLIYNYNDLWFNLRTATFNTGTRTAVQGNDPLSSFSATAANASVAIVSQGISKMGQTWSYLPKFEYTLGDLRIEGRFAYSDSTSSYNPMGRRDMIFSSGSLANTGVSYRAERSSYETADWKITQTGGSSWSDGSSFTAPTITVNDGRSASATVGSGELVASFRVSQLPMIEWKTGIKAQRESRDYQIQRETSLYSYVGPGSGKGAWKDYSLSAPLDLALLDASAVSSTGSELFVPDIESIAALFREHPEYFRQSFTAANYYNAYVANRKHYVEEIGAGYLMGTARLGKAQLRLGLRGEATQTDSEEPEPRTAAELAAAGYPESGGRATTFEGLQYQYFSKPAIHRRNDYGHLFPSGSFKYRFNRQLEFLLGYSRTIRRPTFKDVAGVWAINDDTQTVTAPNSQLKPELSDNLSARLAYYFEPVGLLAVSVYQNTVKGLHLSSQLTAEEFGYEGDDLSTYTFVTTVASADRVRIRGLELEYSQSLSFLPAPFSGLNVRSAYTRNEAGIINPGMAPHSASAGLNYTAGRLNVYSNFNWIDDTPLNATGTNYRRHRGSLDAGGSVRLRNNLSLFVAVRNLLNTPYINLQRQPGAPAVAINYGEFGSAWTFGLRGTF